MENALLRIREILCPVREIGRALRYLGESLIIRKSWHGVFDYKAFFLFLHFLQHGNHSSTLTCFFNLFSLDGYCQSGERLEQVVFSQTIKNRILEGFIASSQSVSTDQECQMLCILDGMCNSYNLGDQDSSFRHSCQVLRYGVGNQTVKLRKGWSFRARKARDWFKISQT